MRWLMATIVHTKHCYAVAPTKQNQRPPLLRVNGITRFAGWCGCGLLTTIADDDCADGCVVLCCGAGAIAVFCPIEGSSLFGQGNVVRGRKIGLGNRDNQYD